MEALERIKDKVQNFLQENTKLTVAVCAILLSFAAIAFVMGMFSQPPKKAKNKVVLPEAIPFSAVEDFFKPKKENLTEEYYFTREQSSQWTDEEFDRWFTVPTNETVEELGKANNKVTEEILAAAP